MKKTILSLAIIIALPLLSGCGTKPEVKKETTINPLSPSSMVDTYQDSKGKINDSVQKEQDKIDKAFEESGLNE